MKKLLPLMLMLLFLPLCAQAAVYEIADESALPADWAEKDLLRLTMIDTNRSDSMLLECGGEAMLIDGGAGQHRHRVYDMLNRRGITELKYLFASHSDNDHVHGFTYLMSDGFYKVGAFLNPNKIDYTMKGNYHYWAVQAAERMGIPYVQIGAGDQFTLGTATIDVLRCDEPWGQNDRSASALIRFGESRVLTTGDIDSKTMSWHVETYGADIPHCDILKTPHHGLAAVPDDFRLAADPEMLIVPNTYKNLFDETRRFINWVRKHYSEKICKYSGDGAVVCVTDGADWYIWQEPNWVAAE